MKTRVYTSQSPASLITPPQYQQNPHRQSTPRSSQHATPAFVKLEDDANLIFVHIGEVYLSSPLYEQSDVFDAPEGSSSR